MYCLFVKRSLDVLAAVVLMPAVLLVILAAGPFIFLEDRGSIFYYAKRRGKDGKTFNMYKLRTMNVNAPDLRNQDGSTYNGKDDQRVTRTGRILRETSMDELPQMINVLKGDMSFVGPRPNSVRKKYEELCGDKKKRLSVRPGITGYNQAYYRNSISVEERLKNDCFYVDHLSFSLDLKIIIQTAISVLRRKNIYND